MEEATESVRTCRTCDTTKPIDEFRPRGKYRRGTCASCQAAKRKARRQSDSVRESDAATLRRWRLGKFGITPEQYDLLLAAQNGGCAICGSALGDGTGRRLAIDHDHASGRVRGLLCVACNRRLGIFESFRDQALTYLEQYGDGHPLLNGEGTQSQPNGSRRWRTGSDNQNAKLTESMVAEIRERYSAGGVTQRVLAAKFGISQNAVGCIVRREWWK